MNQDIAVQDEWIKRFRAARAYAGLSRADAAKRLGISEATLKRAESGTRPVTEAERRGWASIISEAAGLDPAFFTADLQGALSRATDDRVGELSRVSHAVDELAAQVARLLKDERGSLVA